jgi:hypothetical protein
VLPVPCRLGEAVLVLPQLPAFRNLDGHADSCVYLSERGRECRAAVPEGRGTGEKSGAKEAGMSRGLNELP